MGTMKILGVKAKRYSTSEVRDNILRELELLKTLSPDQEVVMETMSGTVHCKLSEALFYEGMGGSIVIDAE